MAPVTKKRAAPPKGASVPAKKKQKLGGASSAGPAEKVRLDDLAWTEVSLPDQMQDYEGFFGLEEIEGVEVVRDSGSGMVSYTVSDGAKVARKEEGKSGVGALAEEDDDGEWDGIQDDDDPATVPVEHAEKSVKKRAEKVKTGDAKQKNKQQSQPPPTTTDASPTASFSLLPEESGDGDTDISAWRPLRLSSAVLSALSSMRFARPTSIQSSAIPHILGGEDLIGKAPTGSGKTLAFGIPLLEHWLAHHKTAAYTKPMALVVLPTRELAMQIEQHLSAFSKATTSLEEGHGLSIATLTGGLSIQKQRRLLERADVVVATPGRLWEVMSEAQGLLSSLQKIRFLVVDEADRLLSQGHFRELEDVLTTLDREAVPDEEAEEDEKEEKPKDDAPRQTLVFSATLSRDLQQKLAKHTRLGGSSSEKGSMDYLLHKLNFRSEVPRFVDVSPTTQMAVKLREGLVECPGPEKDLYLYTLLLYHPRQHALVFVNSISAVRRLVPFLQNLGLPALALHSQMAQKARIRSIERFGAEGGTTGSILVATDVAARGLDIPAVRLVVHYHLPRTADTYVHRSGRTARAESSGNSILMCAPEEIAGVRRLIVQLHGGGEASKTKRGRAGPMQSLDLDKRVVSRLKPRAALAKKLADAVGAKEKKSSEDAWLREAAEELGVEYDSDEFAAAGQEAGKVRGRGRQRKEREKEARGMTKAEMKQARAELKSLLAQRINVGVSERYLTPGSVDIEALMRGEGKGGFLGRVPDLGFAPMD